ncbi:hypothetical protein KBB27_03835 [Patescibacteria group bacterium]|nr:hypothetical protein [Patescibacteria group bacterium]
MHIWSSWNVRSFLGWKTWWTRVAVIGLVAAFLQAILSRDGAFSMYLALVWILGIAAFSLASAHALARVTKRPVEAMLAGLQAWLPVFWLVPIVDEIVRAWIPSWGASSIWWIAPSQFISRLFLFGCSSAGCPSLGWTVLLLVAAVAIGWMARVFDVTYTKAIGLGVGMYMAFWSALSVLSFTAWSRLSTYGATLASPALVVEQAFLRIWNDTLWLDARERFWTLSTVGNQGSRVLVGGVLLWLVCFSLLAPLLERSVSGEGAWFRRLSEGALIWPAMLAGMLLGAHQGASLSWVAGVAMVAFYGAVAIAVGKAALITTAGHEDDQAWMIRVFALTGAWWLGWPVALLAGFALLARFYGRTASWRLRTLAEAVSAWCLAMAAWSVFAQADLGMVSVGPFVGLFVFLMAQSVWLELAPRIAANEQGIGGLFGEKGPSWNKTTLWAVWTGALLVLWLLVGVFSLGWFVIALSAIFAAALWLFPNLEKNVVYLAWFGTILAGLLLHGGFFLS